MKSIEEKRQLFKQLSQPFPDSAYVRTSGAQTGRGYDTTGLRMITMLARLLEIFGVGSYRIHRNVSVKEITSPKGRPLYQCVVEMVLEVGYWEDGTFKVLAETVGDGGSTSPFDWDARKGATSSALKRCLMGLGIGRECWENLVDEDDEPLPEEVRVSAPLRAGPAQAQAPYAPGPSAPGSQANPPSRPATAPTERNRISSKQHAAIMSIARKGGIDLSSLRTQVRATFQKQVEYLTREEASRVIDGLNAKVNGNGHAESNGAAQAS